MKHYKKFLFFLFVFIVGDSCSQTLLNGNFNSRGLHWNMSGCTTEARYPQRSYGGVGNKIVAEVDVAVSLCQRISGFRIGGSYTLSFKSAKRISNGAMKKVGVRVDQGAMYQIITKQQNIPFIWTNDSYTFCATAKTHLISFKGIPTSGNPGHGIVFKEITLVTNTTTLPTTITGSTICFEDSILLQGQFRNTAGTYYDTLTNQHGCDSIIIQNNLTVTPQNLTVINTTICFEDSILLQGQFQNTSGTYFDTLMTAQFGCDSIIQTNLTVTAHNLTIVNTTICFEDSILLQGQFRNTTGAYFDTLTANQFGCDSVVQTNLTVTPHNLTVINTTICFGDSAMIKGQFRKNSGTYFDTLTATQFGCDSVIQTNLTVTPHNLTVVNTTICFGDSAMIKGQFRNTSGTYFDTLTAAQFGCDSIIQTNLTVTPHNLTAVNTTICFEDSILLQGQFRNTTGTYFDTLTASQFGCDSIVKTNLTVTPHNLTVVNTKICFEDYILLQGQFQNTTGTYFDTLTAAQFGCDSIIQTNLTVTPHNLTVINTTICFEDSILLQGQLRNTSGTYFDTLTAAQFGCDSIVQTNLTVTPHNLTVINTTICFEDSILLQGQFQNTTGAYFDTLTAAQFGCDSIIQTNLTVTPHNLTVVNTTICFEGSILLQGQFQNTTGTYFDTLTAVQFGCDSIIQTNLTVTPHNLTAVNTTICFEDSILLQGQFRNTTGTYFDTLTASQFGCDSIVKTNLTVTPHNLTVINTTICFEDSILLQEQFQNTTGTYFDTLTAAQFGCDSVVQTNLTVTPHNLTVVNTSICFEDSILLQGQFQNTTGTYFDTLTTAQYGCDSIVQTNLTVTPHNLTVVNTSICFGDSILLQAQFRNTSGTYFDTLTAAQFGCDSIVQTNLTVTPHNLTVVNTSICFEDSILLQGQFQNTTGTYFDTLTTAQYGCDSVIQTNLTVIPDINLNLGNDTTICEGESINITINHSNAKVLWSNGSTDNPLTSTGGFYSVIVIQNGCTYTDSILISVSQNPLPDLGKDQEHCFTYSPLKLKTENSFYKYLWSTGDTTDITYADEEEIYSVTVMNIHGCTGYDEVYIEEVCPPVVFVPNSFTPNNDGINDVLNIVVSKNVLVKSLKIFNRWGEIVFEGNPNNYFWDGTHNRGQIQLESYLYLFEYYTKGSVTKSYVKSGHIKVIR